MEVIPAIDLLGGKCVRLYQGDFARVTHYANDPVVLAESYREAGMKRLHLVDLDGARTGLPGNLDTVRRLAALDGLAVQVGGGIRDQATAESLLNAGAARVVVGSVAVSDPAKVTGWLRVAGAERYVLAFDVRLQPGGSPLAVTHGWQESSDQTLWRLIETYLDAGARYFLCTDVGRDGTLAGTNNALYAECASRYPSARIIASGGLSCAADLPGLAATGVHAVVTGKALLDGRLTLTEIRQFSRAG